jgi:myosin protein heavy chain
LKFSEQDQKDLFRCIAAIFHLGNLSFETNKYDLADITASSTTVMEKLCHVLGVSVNEFTKSLLKPQIKAGKDFVTQAKTVEQVLYSVEALARNIYERMFGYIVDKINETINSSSTKSSYIGVLDIAGFEIFEVTLI